MPFRALQANRGTAPETQIPLPLPQRYSALFSGLTLLFVMASGGCVRIYEPMSGLHQPVVVDTQVANFPDVHLTLHCVPGDLLSKENATVLCRKVTTLFENQGAKVRMIDTVNRADDVFEDQLEEPPESGDDQPRTGLTVELRARQLHKSTHPLSWVLCVGSFTLLPGVTESTFAQDIVIRDESGFLLVTDTLVGRHVHRFGASAWIGNRIADITWRKKSERLTLDAADEDLSSDLYRQLSQLAFNAKMQAQVYRESAPREMP